MSDHLLCSPNSTKTRLKLLSKVLNRSPGRASPCLYKRKPRNVRVVAARAVAIHTPRGPVAPFSRVSQGVGIATKPRLPSPACDVSQVPSSPSTGRGFGRGHGLLLSTSQREDQMERCASGEAVVVGGLVIGPGVVVKTLVSSLVRFLVLVSASSPSPGCRRLPLTRIVVGPMRRRPTRLACCVVGWKDSR